MRKIWQLSFLLMFLFFACEKDNEKPNPDPGTDPPDPIPVSETEIGYQGGTFEYEGFKMTVPEGCFNGYFKINLLENPSKESFDEKEASVFYTLKGVPVEFLEPVEITLEASGGQDLFAVVGQDVKATSNSGSGISFRFIDVNQDGSSFNFTLDATDIPDYATDDTISFVIGLVKDYVKIESKGKFKIFAPAVYADEAADLQQFLEEAYSKFESSAMGFSYNKRSKWPVEVTIRKLPAGTYGYFVPSKWGDNSGYMEFNENLLSDKNELRLTAGHEFFHLVQALYDPRYGFVKAVSSSDYYWVEEAASVWAEQLFTEENNYCSSIRNGHQMAPFRGVFDAAAENPQHHGYGMSAFIKYMTGKYGNEKLAKVFEHEQSGSSNITAGFSNAIPDPLSSFYPEFLDKYIQGDVYKDFGASSLLAEVAGTFTVNAASDTIKSFEMNYPGLSARIFKIDINYDGLSDQNSLLIKNPDGLKKLIYKIKGSDLTLLGTALGDFTVSNIKQIQQENSLIIVVVVNQHLSNQDEKLELKINTTPPLQLEGCKFTLKNLPAVEHLVKPDGSTMTQNVIYSYTFDDDFFRDGTYINGNFYASWDESGSWRHKGTMNLVIDEQNRVITSGSIEAEMVSAYNPETTYERIKIEFSNLPATSWGSDVIYFGVSGDEFCNPAVITYFYEENAQLNYFRTLQSYSCSTVNTFAIKLSRTQ